MRGEMLSAAEAFLPKLAKIIEGGYISDQGFLFWKKKCQAACI